MGMAYTKVNNDAADHLGFGAGLLCTGFDPATGAVTGIFGATTGGITFNPNPEYTDFAEDVDQLPNNLMEFKRITAWDPVLSGNLVEIRPLTAKHLAGAADLNADTGKITVRDILKTSDFIPAVWWVGDYTNANKNGVSPSPAKAGFIAIKLMNVLNTTGLQVSGTKGEKQQYAFEFHGHYTIEDQDQVPFEIYIKEGVTDEPIELRVMSVAGSTAGYTAITVTGYELGTNEAWKYKLTDDVPTVYKGDSTSTGWTAWDGDDPIEAATGNVITVVATDASGGVIAAGHTNVTSKAST